jgi:hypothetical protein
VAGVEIDEIACTHVTGVRQLYVGVHDRIPNWAHPRARHGRPERRQIDSLSDQTGSFGHKAFETPCELLVIEIVPEEGTYQFRGEYAGLPVLLGTAGSGLHLRIESIEGAFAVLGHGARNEYCVTDTPPERSDDCGHRTSRKRVANQNDLFESSNVDIRHNRCGCTFDGD